MSANTDQRHNVGVIIIAWCLALLTFGYMLPWAISASRGKSNATAIGLLDLLLGWTVIGWIAALIMACGTHQYVPVPVIAIGAQPAPGMFPQQAPPAGFYAAPDGSGRQAYWNGAQWSQAPLA